MTGDQNEGRVDQAYYDQSEYHDGAAHLVDFDSPFQRYRIEKILALYEPGREERVLDLGCGWGTVTFALAHRVREIVGLDFSVRAVAFCEAELAKRELTNVRFIQADARDSGLEPDSFDLIVAADLLEHLYPDDSRRVIDECRRLLKPGGRLSVWTPHRGHFLEILKNNGIFLKPDPTHVDYKSMARVERLLKDAGFVLEKAYYAESHLPVLRDIERTLIQLSLFRRRIAVLARKVGR
jgi:cyclopropane fatty-acyl-phospholipid synthase-like methyltransferase